MNQIHFRTERGKHCFIARYEGYAVRVFDAYPQEKGNWTPVDEFYWGDVQKNKDVVYWVTLPEATKIQNICAFHGLAPRVYDIVMVYYGSQRYYGQVCEDAGKEIAATQDEADAVYGKVMELGKEYGFEVDKQDVQQADVINGLLVDFNTFHFTKDHDEKVRKRYIELGKYGKIYYHDVPEWGLKNAPRENEKRIKWLGFDKVHFKDKSYMDLGCAGGFFTRYAKDKGASATGVDHKGCGSPDPVLGAQLVSNELGYWDVNYLDIDLRESKPPVSHDIVSFLSMNYHIGIPEWLPDVTKELCIFEDNSKNRDALPTLEKMFNHVKKVGVAKDHGDKPVYHCYK